MASILLVVRLIAVLLFITNCILGNSCDCDMVRNILTNEIFDLKVENQQLTSRIEKVELAMRTKTPVYQSTKTDIGRIEMMETRINSIESNLPDSTTYSGNLQRRIAKWLRSEKIERVKSERKLAAGLEEIDDNLKTFKVKSDAVLVSHIGNISDRIGDIKRELSENISLVRNKVMDVSNNVVKLANQTRFLMENNITTIEMSMDAMNSDFSKIDADMEAMYSDFSKIDADIKAFIDIVLLEQKAKCTSDCANGGVCFRNNTCKCKPFTEGPRCAKVICEDKCYANGGKCIGPGTCKCPEDRQGSNCEQVLRCELISNYYGGDVTYLGDRKLYSQAFYRCNDAFSLFPRDVDMSECDGTFSWIPDPPKCYKKTKREIPANGYSPGRESDTLLHLQSYEMCCYKGYELKSDVYMEEKCMRLTNNNGTLVPKVPECVEARCLFSGYPSNEHTFHRIHLADSRLVAKDQYVHPGQKIEVFCPNRTEHKLYVNRQAYLKEFTSECKQGRFDKKKEEFPICLGPKPMSERAGLRPGKSGLDIVLLVDTSSSIGDKSLASAKKLMKLLVDIFGVSDKPSGGENGTRFALVTFSSDATIHFNLDDANARSKEAVKTSIDAIQNTGGGADIRNALLNVMNEIHGRKIWFAADKSRYFHATRAVFIITDTEATANLEEDRLDRIRRAANYLKEEALFEIFTIGFGKNIDKFVLSEIASTPHAEHVFLLAQFKDLERVGDIIAGRNIDYGQCGISGKTEIPQGSHEATTGAWPWLGWFWVSSVSFPARTCGGAMVCDRWFLTAASCVSRVEDNQVVPLNASEINVYLSDFNIYQMDVSEIWPVVKDVLIHDSYTGEEIGTLGIRANDVALLDLGEDVRERPTFNKFLRPICFATGSTSLASADAHLQAMLSFPQSFDAFTAGWGYGPNTTMHTDILFEQMMQNRRPVQKRKACRGRYPGIDMDRFFCVGEAFQESDSCMGDVGGPYMVPLPNKRYYSIGLALNTRNCHERYRFSIFLNLLHPTISQWMAPILDGCNRVEEIDI